MIGAVESLRCELQDADLDDGIKVTTASPFFVRTAMLDSMDVQSPCVISQTLRIRLQLQLHAAADAEACGAWHRQRRPLGEGPRVRARTLVAWVPRPESVRCVGNYFFFLGVVQQEFPRIIFRVPPLTHLQTRFADFSRFAP